MAAGLKEAPKPVSPRPPSAPPKAKLRHAPPWTRACVILGSLLLVLSSGTLAAAWGLSARYESNLKRQDILSGIPGAEKSTYTEGPLNFLVLGSDSREADPTVGANTAGQQSDTIMLVHVDRSLKNASVVSIPRDSYVDIPPSGENWLGGKNKINAAFALGGAALTAQTVHQLTNLPLHGAFIFDFNSVRKLVGIVGGVTVTIPFDMRSTHTDRVWKKGANYLTADAAQDFMRQRKSVPGGDFGRIQNQQRVVMALAKKITSKGILTDPVRLDRVLNTMARSVIVDGNVDIRDLVLGLKDIRPDNLKFATLPFVNDNLLTPYGSSVELDEAGCAELFAALRDDTMEQWHAAHPPKPAGG